MDAWNALYGVVSLIVLCQMFTGEPLDTISTLYKYLLSHRERMVRLQKQQISGDEIIRLNAMNQIREIDWREETLYLAGDSNMVLIQNKDGGYQLLGTPKEVSRRYSKYAGLDEYLNEEIIKQRLADRTVELPRLSDRI